jgi:thioredoxin reductase (NADPH)
MESCDIFIVGGGVAGLSAALYGGWLGRRVILAEREMFGGQIVNAGKIENYPGFHEPILGADLGAQLRMQALKFGARMQYLEITSLERRDAIFYLGSAEAAYEAGTVIVATGGRVRRLDVKGESEFAGRGVSYCATCDGAFFADKPVAVIGGGDTALDEALYLAETCSRVAIIHRGRAPNASSTLVRRARETPRIEWIAETEVAEILGDDSVEGLRLTNGSTHAANGVFVAVGYEPQTSLLRGIADIDEGGHAKVDLHMQTSVPGLFAVGSARQGSSGQLASSAGDGVTAAIFSHRYILSKS